MLRTLSIRNVVLIDKLDLSFGEGLCVLTGETGSGKSILLDALGLATGSRAEAGLVRSGTDQAIVTAEFDVGSDHAVSAVLQEHGLEPDDRLVLRRTVGADGRSRAYINDQAASVGLLRRIGGLLAEVHGQHETHGLLDPANHRRLLDAFGGYGVDLEKTAAAYRAWRAAVDARADAEAAIARAREDEAYLRHVVKELTDANPQPGEETDLAGRRSLLMHGEQILEAANEAFAALNEGSGVEGALRTAFSKIERVAAKADGKFDAAVAALDRALNETADAVAELERASSAVEIDPSELERVEERLFALRGLARKHNCDVDELAGVRDRMEAQLATVEEGTSALDRLRKAEADAQAAFVAAAGALTEQRENAAAKLAKAVNAELPPLKLGDARLEAVLEPLGEENWGEGGCERVIFHVQTNPNTPMGPLHRIASGGELARLMLALKVVLADADPVATLIFDEVDAGIGGAAADAVGERLSRLAADVQVLVVTHSPQVAARGAHHLRITKAGSEGGNRTSVDPLADEARTEEIARMLAGATVTDEARAAALSLLGRG